MRNKKVKLAGVLLAITMLAGCDLTAPLSEELVNPYKEAAIAYLAEKYPDVEFTFTSMNENNSMGILQASFTENSEIVRVLNARTNPIDDYQYVKWSDEAKELLIDYALPIYGKDIKVIMYEDRYFTDADAPIATTAVEYLQQNKGAMFGLAVTGAPTNRENDLEAFINVLNENGITQSFGVFYYNDYATLDDNFNLDTAFTGVGSFKNWVLCVDNVPGEWHDSGKSNSSNSEASK